MPIEPISSTPQCRPGPAPWRRVTYERLRARAIEKLNAYHAALDLRLWRVFAKLAPGEFAGRASANRQPKYVISVRTSRASRRCRCGHPMKRADSRSTYERFADLPENVSALRRPFGTAPSPTVRSIDQPCAVSGALSLCKAGLRMAGKLGSAGPATYCRAPNHAMDLKNTHVDVRPATERAVVEGECPTCHCIIRRPLSSFKRLGYLCDCGTTITSLMSQGHFSTPPSRKRDAPPKSKGHLTSLFCVPISSATRRLALANSWRAFARACSRATH
jgi:hypothetical protein